MGSRIIRIDAPSRFFTLDTLIAAFVVALADGAAALGHTDSAAAMCEEPETVEVWDERDAVIDLLRAAQLRRLQRLRGEAAEIFDQLVDDGVDVDAAIAMARLLSEERR